MIFRKCAHESGIVEHKKIINRLHELPVTQQCKALQLDQTTIYREATHVKQSDLELMRLISSIHMASHEWESRKFCDWLIALEFPIGGRPCTTLFRKLGIHCIYRKPRTTIRHIGHKVYLYVLRRLGIKKANQVWVMDITTIPGGKRLCVSNGCQRHLQQKESVKVDLKHPGCEFLR